VVNPVCYGLDLTAGAGVVTPSPGPFMLVPGPDAGDGSGG